MADEDDDVLTASDVEEDVTPLRYGRANTYSMRKRKAKEVTETHHSINQQVEAFLKSGRKIQKISHGVSGMPDVQAGGRRHIQIGNKYRTA